VHLPCSTLMPNKTTGISLFTLGLSMWTIGPRIRYRIGRPGKRITKVAVVISSAFLSADVDIKFAKLVDLFVGSDLVEQPKASVVAF